GSQGALPGPDPQGRGRRWWGERHARPPARQLAHNQAVERSRRAGPGQEDLVLDREDQRERGPEAKAVEEQSPDPDQLSEVWVVDVARRLARDRMHGAIQGDARAPRPGTRGGGVRKLSTRGQSPR